MVAKRYTTTLSVLIFDIDYFKKLNDQYGHQTGDLVLKQVARIAHDNSREADVLARYGGEEFIMVLPNTNSSGAFALAESIRSRIATHREKIGETKLKITISVGVADILPEEDSLDEIIRRADKALYAAKRAGRNCSRIYSASC